MFTYQNIFNQHVITIYKNPLLQQQMFCLLYPSIGQSSIFIPVSKKQTPLLLCYMYLIPVNDRKWDNNKKNSNKRCPETLLYLSKEARFFFVWNSCVAVTPVSCIIMHPWCTWVLQEKEAAGLAQSVEWLTAERDVVGLIPRAGLIHSESLT